MGRLKRKTTRGCSSYIPLIWKGQIFSPRDLVLELINLISKECWSFLFLNCAVTAMPPTPWQFSSSVSSEHSVTTFPLLWFKTFTTVLIYAAHGEHFHILPLTFKYFKNIMCLSSLLSTFHKPHSYTKGHGCFQTFDHSCFPLPGCLQCSSSSLKCIPGVLPSRKEGAQEMRGLKAGEQWDK